MASSGSSSRAARSVGELRAVLGAFLVSYLADEMADFGTASVLSVRVTKDRSLVTVGVHSERNTAKLPKFLAAKKVELTEFLSSPHCRVSFSRMPAFRFVVEQPESASERVLRLIASEGNRYGITTDAYPTTSAPKNTPDA